MQSIAKSHGLSLANVQVDLGKSRSSYVSANFGLNPASRL
jgi:hypothetical protein